MKKGVTLGLENLRDPIRGIAFVVAVAGLVLALPFLSYSLTGHTVANLTQGACDIIGVSLFCVGLVGFLVYVRRR